MNLPRLLKPKNRVKLKIQNISNNETAEQLRGRIKNALLILKKMGTKIGTLVGTQQYSSDLVALLKENKKLKQQLKNTEMEKDFLKKAAAYFAKES